MELTEAVSAMYVGEYRPRFVSLGFGDPVLTVEKNNWNLSTNTGVQIAKFLLRPFPNCSALVISYGIEVTPGYRYHGVGTLLLRMQMAACRMAGYTAMIATVRTDNEVERHIMKKLGWIESPASFASRHGGFVSTWEVIL